MAIELTTTEAAERIGVPIGTLKGWLNKIPVPMSVDSSGKRRIGPEGLELLEQVKALRLDEGRGMDTIRRRLDLDEAEPSRGSVLGSSEPRLGLGSDEAETSRGSVGASSVDTAVIVAQVVEAIASQTDLAEKYARATYTIGQLEERTTSLSAQLEAAKEKALLLTEAESARDNLGRLVDDLKAKNSELEAHLARMTKRPWWRPW